MKSVCFALTFSIFLAGWLLNTNAGESSPMNESFGKLRLEQRQEKVIALLGQPVSKGPDEHWDAIGQWVQEWRFKEGIQLNMASKTKGGIKTVFSITATAPCTWATERGIKIGSPESEVLKVYKGTTAKGEEQTPGSFLAGSIYGGIIFDFKAGRVSTIFIGAAAE